MTFPCLDLNSKTFAQYSAIANNVNVAINSKVILLMITSKIPFQFIFNKSGYYRDTNRSSPLCLRLFWEASIFTHGIFSIICGRWLIRRMAR